MRFPLIDSYDWYQKYDSIKNIEEDLPGFKFNGEGWYIDSTDTLLIEEFQDKYRVYCWNHPSGFKDILERSIKVLTLPIRVNSS